MCPRRTWSAGRPGSGSTGICAAPAVPCGAASVPPFRDRRGRTLRSAGSSWGLAMRNRQQGITAIDRHFEIDMVDYPTTKDIQIRREGTKWVIEAKYDDEAPMLGNVSLHVTFDKVVRTSGGGGD